MAGLNEFLEELNEMPDKQAMSILEKAKEFQKKRNIIMNQLEDDLLKGNARNIPCPLCNHKLKKCKCELKEKMLKK